MGKKTIILILIIALACTKNQPQLYDYPITAVGIKNVVINDNFWLPKIKTIQDSTILYAFEKCDAEGRMENFRIAGGEKSGKVCGKMPFDDTDLYKIIEGASYSLISTPNPALEIYLDSIISIIKTGQEPDGYLTTWFTIDRQNPPAAWVKPSKNRWENEISSHELYNSGHLFEAAAAHYLATGKRNFLDIALKNADLLVGHFGPGKLTCPPGHQIVETGLIKLYTISHNTKYLELAKFFLDIRGDSTTHKLYGAYNQDHKPVVQQDEVVGHAVRAVYMYAAMTDIAAFYHDPDYLDAINKLWENMVNKKMYITGGIGARHEGESFGDNYELPNLTAYNETCAAIGNVYWNQRMFQLTANSKYYDIIERSLYNGLISGISLGGTKFFYPNPLESDGKYQFNFGSSTRQPWFDCSCCPTNLIRFIPSIPGLIYATDKDDLYLNLFISNTANVSINDKNAKISMKTNYPWDGNIKIIVSPEEKMNFTLHIRVPGWVQNQAIPGDLYSYEGENDQQVILKLNGIESGPIIKNGYIEIKREWVKGDSVQLILPMTVHKVIANEKIKADSSKVAIEYGPLVYCAEEVDNPEFSDINIPEGVSFNIEKKTILSENINIIKANSTGKEFTLVPYYLWSNRGVGKMKVWFSADLE